MDSEPSVISLAVSLLFSGDADLYEIIGLSLRVTLTAVFISLVIGLPLGAFLAVYRFRGRGVAVAILNTLMGLPPVVVGLIVYLMLSRSGPLGVFGLLYTPTAMIIAQTVLVTPLVAALARQTLHDVHQEYDELFRSLRLSTSEKIRALLWDARFGLVTSGLAGFGRAIAEVGAVMIVGGNIDHLTRVMTTAIALETSKGNLALALALGAILLLLAMLVNLLAMSVQSFARKHSYA